MILDVEFEEMNSEFEADFGEVIIIKPGGKTYTDGLAEGEAVGREKCWNEYWDAYQHFGERADYAYAFAGLGWTNETFKPKYKMTFTNGTYTFFNSRMSYIPEGIILDTSNCTNINSCFGSSRFIELPIIDLSKCKGAASVWYNASLLRRIEKIITHSGITTYTLAFRNCLELEEIIFEGEIAADIDFGGSKKLNKDSIISLFNTLSSATTGMTATLSKTAVANAFETAVGLADGASSEEWLALVASRSNWTVSLG